MAPQTAITPEFSVGMRETMLDGLCANWKQPRKFLPRFLTTNHEYRPDPHARTAWELAWHIANTDVQFLDGIADLNFKMGTPARKATNQRTSPNSSTGTTRFQPRSADRVRAMSRRATGHPRLIFRRLQFSRCPYLGFLNNHSIHHRGELATYLRPMGSKVPLNLRRQLRRTLHAGRNWKRSLKRLATQ